MGRVETVSRRAVLHAADAARLAQAEFADAARRAQTEFAARRPRR